MTGPTIKVTWVVGARSLEVEAPLAALGSILEVLESRKETPHISPGMLVLTKEDDEEEEILDRLKRIEAKLDFDREERKEQMRELGKLVEGLET